MTTRIATAKDFKIGATLISKKEGFNVLVTNKGENDGEWATKLENEHEWFAYEEYASSYLVNA